jgi:hypothetical protein
MCTTSSSQLPVGGLNSACFAPAGGVSDAAFFDLFAPFAPFSGVFVLARPRFLPFFCAASAFFSSHKVSIWSLPPTDARYSFNIFDAVSLQASG